ncbi:MAG TPA: MMPL family transporter, partial [Nakamurella sp.]
MSIAPHQPPITPDAPGHHAPRSPQPPFRPGPLGRLARLAFCHRGRTVLLWLAAFVVALGQSTAFAGAFNADYSAPGSDSAAAQDLLTSRFPAAANDTVTLVAHSTEPVTTPDFRARIDHVLDQAGAVAHVGGFTDPYQAPGAISPDGRTIVTTLRLNVADPLDMPHESAAALIRIAKDASHDGLTFAVKGVSITNAEAPPIGSEVVGLLAAAVILLLMFGSIVAAGLPILLALAGL